MALQIPPPPPTACLALLLSAPLSVCPWVSVALIHTQAQAYAQACIKPGARRPRHTNKPSVPLCMCACVYACVCAHVCVCVCACVCLCVCMCVRACVCVCV